MAKQDKAAKRAANRMKKLHKAAKGIDKFVASFEFADKDGYTIITEQKPYKDGEHIKQAMEILADEYGIAVKSIKTNVQDDSKITGKTAGGAKDGKKPPVQKETRVEYKPMTEAERAAAYDKITTEREAHDEVHLKLKKRQSDERDDWQKTADKLWEKQRKVKNRGGKQQDAFSQPPPKKLTEKKEPAAPVIPAVKPGEILVEFSSTKKGHVLEVVGMKNLRGMGGAKQALAKKFKVPISDLTYLNLSVGKMDKKKDGK